MPRIDTNDLDRYMDDDDFGPEDNDFQKMRRRDRPKQIESSRRYRDELPEPDSDDIVRSDLRHGD